MKTTMKKGFALLIALIVVLGMFPMAVLATGESEDTTPTITSVTVSGEGVSYIPLAKTYVIAEGTTGDITITISGTNFEHWTENSSFYFKSAHSVPLSEANGWSIDTVDHTASITLGASGFSTARDPYEFGYDVTGGNDDIIGTGYYIVYGEENAPSATIIDIPENAVEITSENATPFTYEGNTASYDAELGWSGVLDSYEDTSFFELDLNAGDKVYYVLSGLSGNVGLYGLNVDNGAYKGEAHLSGSFDVEESGTYCFYTEKNVTAKAYVVRYDVSAPVIPVGKVEITDTYAGLDTSAAETFLGGGGTYTEEIGWSGVPFSENAVVYGYMAVALDKGDVLSLDASEEVTFVVVGLYTETQLDDVRSTFAEYEITETDTYLIAAFGEATMRAYVLEAPASGSVPIPEDLPENAVEITKNDTDDLPPSLVSFLGVYDAAHGWIPNVIEGESSYFAVSLNAGDTVHFYFSEETEYFFGLLSGGLPSPRLSSVTASVTVDTSGVYALASKNDATVRAYVVRAEAEAVEITDTYAGMPPADIADQFSYTEAEGWHGVTLDMLAGKYLYFAVSLDKGDVLMLDFATEVTFNVAALVGDVQYGETLATSAQIEITETGNYMIIADIATTMRAYVVEAPGTGDDEGGDEGGLTEVDTFEELADAMQHSGEIRLIGDIDMGADEIDVEDGAEITLDLNGYNITATSNYPFDIYDAKLTVVGEGSIKTTGYDVFYLNSSDSVLTVEGGDFESSDNVVYVGEGKATLNGGTYTTLGDSEAVSAGDGTLTITGGAYSTNPSDYLTGSYVAGLDGESGYYVVTSDGVVKVDTFEELVDAMQHSGEIRLIGDIDMGADEIDVEDGAEITLDLNGYNITATSNYPFDIYDAKLTVVGEGSIKTTGYDVFYLNNSSSVLIVEGGSFEADEAAVYASEGKATLNGGIYHDPVLSFASDLTITGGAYSTDPSEYLAEGCVAELDEESGYYVVTEKTSSDEGGDEPTPETITIYLDNAKDWSVVYAYAWNDENPSLLGSWPGTQMTEVEDGIFAVELPVSASYIIFSNGTEQTYDQSIPTDGNNLYNNVDGTWSFYEAPEILESAFRSATVSLGSDLSIIYKIFTEEPLADGENAFGVVFTMNGKETLVTEYEDLGDGVYSFTFTGIAPQQMGDLIDAALVTLDADGAVVRVLCTKEDYSVEANLSRIKEAYAGHTTLQQLIDDLLVYGAAAQSYTGYKTDALVGAGMSLAPSMVEPTAEEAMILIGNTNADVYISAVGLWFDNVNNLYVKIHADVEDPSLVTLQVNDDLYSLADLEDLGNGTFKFTSAALYASAFDTDHIFLLSYDEEIVTELVYSVNAYAYGILQSTTESETMKDLALALYRYGVAAQNYLTAGLK